VLAWGGVLAQAVVFVPLGLWVVLFGCTRVEGVNMIFAILGFFCLGVAVFNFLPVGPLDGAMAWRLFPELLAQRKRRIPRKPMHR
jgi:membrane-associated protease RseP (regulator of RpoE activity)